MNKEEKEQFQGMTLIVLSLLDENRKNKTWLTILTLAIVMIIGWMAIK